MVLYVGGHSFYKGFDILIIAIYELSKQRQDLVLMIPKINPRVLLYDYDDKNLKSKIVKLVLELKKKYLIMFPPIADDDMPFLYNLADVVVLPSRLLKNTSSDRSPNVALEALACGQILVASYVGGIPTIAGNAAILVKPNDPHALVTKLSDVLENYAKYKHLKERARRRAMNILDIKLYSRRLLEYAIKFLKSLENGH